MTDNQTPNSPAPREGPAVGAPQTGSSQQGTTTAPGFPGHDLPQEPLGTGGKPNIISLLGRLPTARPELQKFREVGQITRLAVHWDDQYRPVKYNALTRYIDQARYHIDKVWGVDPANQPIKGFGLMYAYKIAGDGQIYQVQDEGLITWSVRNANPITLSVCCDCGTGQVPTQAQLAALHSLLMWLCYHRPEIPACRKDVYGHGELVQYGNDTTCPGSFLPHIVAFRQGTW